MTIITSSFCNLGCYFGIEETSSKPFVIEIRKNLGLTYYFTSDTTNNIISVKHFNDDILLWTKDDENYASSILNLSSNTKVTFIYDKNTKRFSLQKKVDTNPSSTFIANKFFRGDIDKPWLLYPPENKNNIITDSPGINVLIFLVVIIPLTIIISYFIFKYYKSFSL